MKYCLLALIAVSHFSYAGEVENCHATTGGLAVVEACAHSLSIDAEESYEAAYAALLKNPHMLPDMLNNPEEFLDTVKAAKKSWESTVELDCKAEGLLNFKDSFADRTDTYECLYRAYNQRIEHYKALGKR
jgi:hypothetical protein